jgi:hypothetical protein
MQQSPLFAGLSPQKQLRLDVAYLWKMSHRPHCCGLARQGRVRNGVD